MATPIRIEGMAEFRRELREIDKSFPRGIQKANKRTAEIVTERARTLLAATGGVGPKAAQSIRARAGQAYAAVALGGPAYPYAPGQNFGSIQFRQFPAFKHPGEGDYGVYKAVGETRTEVIENYERFVDEGLREVFPD